MDPLMLTSVFKTSQPETFKLLPSNHFSSLASVKLSACSCSCMPCLVPLRTISNKPLLENSVRHKRPTQAAVGLWIITSERSIGSWAFKMPLLAILLTQGPTQPCGWIEVIANPSQESLLKYVLRLAGRDVGLFSVMWAQTPPTFPSPLSLNSRSTTKLRVIILAHHARIPWWRTSRAASTRSFL